ncbi:MAG: N-acetylmuramic acid 6-phosphate etherase [Enterobacterales bacterium]|nr:N-acetylmuramic acid 6-phosphate etherase [Enterobacterales bacterium]
MTDALRHQLKRLVSEGQNPATQDIDLLDSNGIIELLHSQDDMVQKAISDVLPSLAQAVDWVVAALGAGGRLIYIGAGTSGRLGVLDAVECIPTFGIPEGLVVGVLAGGEQAMFRAQEGIEDRPEVGKADLISHNFSRRDVLVGIAASGRTPYVLGAMAYAQAIGAKTIALCCNPNAQLLDNADLSIVPVVGPETPAGSSRMKAGTAQKQILNMLSTASMIRLGKCYQNLMIDVKPSNDKLRARSLNMLMQVTGVNASCAEQALVDAGDEVKVAAFMLLKNCPAKEARMTLDKHGGFLRQALLGLSN